MRWILMLHLIAIAACNDKAPAVARIEGDSVDVVTIRHDADAFDNAPQWTLDSAPVVVYDGGANPDFDLTYAGPPTRLPDGRLLALNRINGGRLMLFDASGNPIRVLARAGEGPGELMAPSGPLMVSGDTIGINDDANNRVSYFSAKDGFLSSKRHAQWRGADCANPYGTLADGRVVRVSRCFGAAPVGRLPMLVVTTNRDLSAPDTVAVLPGIEFVPFVTRYRGAAREHPQPLRFYRDVHAAAWDSLVVTATGDEGYVLEYRAPNGPIQHRVVVDRPRRVVTDAMREAQIALELERLTASRVERMVDPEESRRQAREVPFADSLPPYANLLSVSGGWLWVIDYATPGDTGWTATAFTKSGQVAVRISSPRTGTPVWFSADEVMVRETDDDGVVRFTVYRMKKHD